MKYQLRVLCMGYCMNILVMCMTKLLVVLVIKHLTQCTLLWMYFNLRVPNIMHIYVLNKVCVYICMYKYIDT